MKESGYRKIGNRTYTVSDWSPIKALKWQRRLMPRIMKTVALAAGSLTGEKLDPSSLAGAVEAVFDGLSEDDMISWSKELLEGVLVDNRALVLEADFGGGQMMELNQVLAFVVEHQFRDFFGVVRGALGKSAETIRQKVLSTRGA